MNPHPQLNGWYCYRRPTLAGRMGRIVGYLILPVVYLKRRITRSKGSI